MKHKEIRAILSRRFADVKRSRRGIWTGRDFLAGTVKAQHVRHVLGKSDADAEEWAEYMKESRGEGN